MTSTDGFCSVVMFAPGELGERYTGIVHGPATPTSVSTPTFPLTSTPSNRAGSTPIPPLSPAQHPTQRPGSPGSPSVSSINSGTAVNNPTPTLGTLPGVTISGVSVTTPPPTPLNGGNCSSSVLGKRDGAPKPSSSTHSEEAVNRTDAPETPAEQPGGDKKRRRVAPTLVTSSTR